MIVDWAPDGVVLEIRAADAAARAARAVPGVVRLQPGVIGLLTQFAMQAWERATGQDLPDIAGVTSRLVGDGAELTVELQLVVDGGYHATQVGVAVQDAVAAAVLAELGRPVTTVTVRIVEITLDL